MKKSFFVALFFLLTEPFLCQFQYAATHRPVNVTFSYVLFK